jgi:hypothetical protein
VFHSEDADKRPSGFWILAITVVDDALAAWWSEAAVDEGQQQHVVVGGAVDPYVSDR